MNGFSYLSAHDTRYVFSDYCQNLQNCSESHFMTILFEKNYHHIIYTHIQNSYYCLKKNIYIYVKKYLLIIQILLNHSNGIQKN